jgi:hypothetical protein
MRSVRRRTTRIALGSGLLVSLHTYCNATSNVETDIQDSVPVRGDDFGHYASLTEIRSEAGFDNAYNLSDVTITSNVGPPRQRSTLRWARSTQPRSRLYLTLFTP